MGSMHTGLEGWHNRKRLRAFYEARAKGGTGLMRTGGYSPNIRGKLSPFASTFNSFYDVIKHKAYTDAVHQHGGKICLQLLHMHIHSIKRQAQFRHLLIRINLKKCR